MESIKRYAKNNNLEIVFNINSQGYNRIFYDNIEGKYYDKHTDLFLRDEELKKWRLS